MHRAHQGLVALLVIGAFGCQGDRGRAGIMALLTTTDLAPGAECGAGGTQINTGLDSNRNHTLDAEEITDTMTVCNEADSRVLVENVAPSEDCPFGATLVSVGIDDNGDGTLAASEVDSAETFCAVRVESFSGLVFQVPTYATSSMVASALARDLADGSGYMPLAATRAANTGIIRFKVSPDRKWVAFKAKMDVDKPAALHVASLVDDWPVREVSGPQFNDGSAVGDTFEWAPNSSRLAFAAPNLDSSSTKLFTVKPDGSTRVRLDQPANTTGSNILAFAWSPNSTHVAFRSDQDTDGTQELYVAPADGGSAPTKLSCEAAIATATATAMAWAPDSKHIAFWQISGGTTYDLHIGELGTPTDCGSSIARRNNLDSLSVAWQPIDTALVLLFGGAQVDNSNSGDLYTYNVTAGGNPTRISCDLGSGQTANNAKWAPNGSMIAYLSDSNSTGVFELYLAPPNGTGTCVAASAALTSGYQVASDLAWSPKSDVVAYHTIGVADENRGSLYTVAAAAGTATQVHGSVCVTSYADQQCDKTFEWSADGRIAYVGDSNSGGRSLFVATPGATGVAVSSAAITAVWNLAWSRDSGHLAFLGSEDGTAWNLYTVTPDGVTQAQASPSGLPASMHSDAQSYTAQYAW